MRTVLAAAVGVVALASATSAAAYCLPSVHIMDGAGPTIPTHGVLFVHVTCGGGGVEMHPTSGTSRTTRVDGYEIIEFDGIAGAVPITVERGNARELAILVDADWKRPTRAPRLLRLSHDTTTISCPHWNDLHFHLDRGAAGLEIRWTEQGVERVSRFGIRSHDDHFVAIHDLDGVISPEQGAMLTLTVIEGDGSRTAVSPPTIVMPDLYRLSHPLPPPPAIARAPRGADHRWLGGLIAGLIALALVRWRTVQSPTETMNM